MVVNPPVFVDPGARDPTIRPGDDFLGYAVGGWLRQALVPADRKQWGTIEMLNEQSHCDQRVIVERLALVNPPHGSDEQKVADYYRSLVAGDEIDRLGLVPLEQDLDAVERLRSYDDLAAFAADPAVLTAFPLQAVVVLDDAQPQRYVVSIRQSGLGLPDRAYYVGDSASLHSVRTAYESHVERILALAGVSGAALKAHRVVEIETRIARIHWSNAERRERERVYNPVSEGGLQALAPTFPWGPWLLAAGLHTIDEFVVGEVTAIGALARLVLDTELEVWRAYFLWHLLRRHANSLPEAFRKEHFDFYERALEGRQQPCDRLDEAIDVVSAVLPDAVGRFYVKEHFSPRAQEVAREVVEEVRAAFARRIQVADWLSRPGREALLEKLSAMRLKLGYPEAWRDYSALDVRRGDPIGNARRAASWHWEVDRARLDRPSNPDEWPMPPQTVNAYYGPWFNDLVIPAAILRAPLFDPAAVRATNFGGIGAVIGHEISHAFDDQGVKSDGRGVLGQWWPAGDQAAFRRRTAAVKLQYELFAPLPDVNVNGQLTLGENIADIAGLQAAYDAFCRGAGHEDAGFEEEKITGEQLFFISWAHVWRSVCHERALRNVLINGPHAPAEVRCNGTVRNIDGWYTAFDVAPCDALYLPPAERVTIW